LAAYDDIKADNLETSRTSLGNKGKENAAPDNANLVPHRKEKGQAVNEVYIFGSIITVIYIPVAD